MYFSLTVICGLLAAGAAWQLNSLFLRFGQRPSIAWSAPVIEESVKTGLALVFRVSVPGVHLIFGLVEALYDVLTPPRSGVTTVLTSVLGHLGFGLLTMYLTMFTGTFFWGWLGAVLAHLAWNNVVVASSD